MVVCYVRISYLVEPGNKAIPLALMPHMLQNEINSPKNSFVYSFIQLINDFIQITGLRGDPEEKLAAEWIKWAPKVITYTAEIRSQNSNNDQHNYNAIENAVVIPCISCQKRSQ